MNSREGNQAQAGVLRDPEPVLDAGVGTVTGLEERQLSSCGVGNDDLVVPLVGCFEQRKLRTGMGPFASHDQPHPARSLPEVEAPGELSNVTTFMVLPADMRVSTPARVQA